MTAASPDPTSRRLNWGCGAEGEPGWTNSDVKTGPGIQLPADIRDGLPVPDHSFDYAVSVHALPELPYPDLVPALAELHRVLEPGGTLRLVPPDLDRGVDAYRRGDAGYFEIPDDVARSPGARLCIQLTWFGYSRSVFTWDFIRELLERAGFVRIRRCRYRVTASRHPGITELDDRPAESLFVEASTPEAGAQPSGP